MWQTGNNISEYKSYPRIVGETGRAGFVFVTRIQEYELGTALIRGALSTRDRNVPLHPALISRVRDDLKDSYLRDENGKMGDVEDFSNFIMR
jgi:1-pyrroline-5-carboxylate dehydrogenase